MSGIDRLRMLAGEWDAYGLGGALEDVARQIERERACDEDAIENVRLIVGGVVDDMERHVSGVEGAEDSPVARWARELRRALKSDASDSAESQNPSCADAAETAGVTSEAPKVTRGPAEDVSMSAYDLLTREECDAIAWVRDHGGLDHVREEWRSRIPYDRYERRRQRLLGHIAECETALGRRRETISKLGHRVSDLTNENAELRRRAMPEGYEWPRYEGGPLLRYGDSYIGNDGNNHRAWQIRFDSNADVHVSRSEDGDGFDRTTWDHFNKGERVRRPAVIAADGEPLEQGQTVWPVEGGGPLYVDRVDVGGQRVTTRPFGLSTALDEMEFEPSQLTHTKPEPPDSWERIEEDARGLDSGVDIELFTHTHEDIVRRCRALAERERGE